ncbi:hypothetical protein PV325_001061 [Microctonus aethiopoides]|nr:hypothetical protein PV325_001061 [Microctonus aethiopoides]KAK0098492.1 hypothetical protein PV326_007923 [Microctonus aethiopoides]
MDDGKIHITVGNVNDVKGGQTTGERCGRQQGDGGSGRGSAHIPRTISSRHCDELSRENRPSQPSSACLQASGEDMFIREITTQLFPFPALYYVYATIMVWSLFTS